MTTIHTRKITTRELGEHYVGCIRVYENGKFLWQERSKLTRLNREDALEDAKIMRKELEAK